MKDINMMRIGVLREIKNIHRFFNLMERTVKTRNPEAIQKAYMFIKALVVQMETGELSPDNVALNLELERALMEMDS